MRMMLTAALKTDAQSDGRAESPPLPGERFHVVIIVEEEWTGDGRFFKAGSVAWRGLPLPMMAQDWTDIEHMRAVLIGNIDTIERIGAEIHGWGSYADPLGDETIIRLQSRMKEGRLPGVSADMDDPEYEVIIPGEMMTFDEENEKIEDDSGDTRIPVTEMIRMEFGHVRIVGATALPFQALDGARVVLDEMADLNPEVEEDREQLVAAAIARGWGFVDCDCTAPTAPLAEWAPERPAQPAPRADVRTLVAATTAMVQAPDVPPLEWFANPRLSRRTPITVENDGRLYGHLAAWGDCHIGFADRCVTPPHSLTSYAHFLTGELITDDGSRLPVGQITMDTGHASVDWSAPKAVAHYDNTGWVAADINVGEDDHGIWVAGALRPGLSAAAVRALMAADLSGDWRRIGRGLELVAALAVNVPGFHKPRVQVAQRDGMVASLIACLPVVERTATGRRRRPLDRRAVEYIAASVGRSTQQRIAEQVARVKDGR